MASAKKDSSEHTLAWVTGEFERAGRVVFADGIYPCDVGAVVLAELCDRAGLKREVVTGLYWHDSLKDYARTVGEEYRALEESLRPGSDPSAPREELHTWCVAHTEGSEPILLDPNGGLRGEPLAQPLSEATRYEPLAEGDPSIELPRDVRAAQLAAERWDARLVQVLAVLRHPARR